MSIDNLSHEQSHAAPESTSGQVTEECAQRAIAEDIRRGATVEAVVQKAAAMGMEAAHAEKYAESAIVEYLTERGARIDASALDVMPEPPLADAPTTLWAGDREVRVLMSIQHPRIVLFGDFLAHNECDALIEMAGDRIVRSTTLDVETGQGQQHEARTSRSMCFERGQTDLLKAIERRISALLNWPVEKGEGIQVLSYEPGQEYKPHYDYFDPVHAGSRLTLRRGGQRLATVLMYLSTPDKGGATVFPNARTEIMPVKGNAVFFSYDSPSPETGSFHGGSPVIAGRKWVATKWLREHDFS
jgi:prolyl 4-hydroxylase